jgi:Txe/YoeB family toxin of Txe-Axe toxin-antitoxin module
MNDLVLTGGAGLFLGDADDGGRRKLSWLRLLEKKIETYTHGESSSVPLETAGSLLRSILYTAAYAPNDFTGELKEPEALYREGRDVLSRQFKKAKRLCYLVQNTMLVAR